MDSNKVWYYAHLGFAIALFVLSAVSFGLLMVNSNLPIVTDFPGSMIFIFVVPGALLVFAINQLILWRRKPRVFRTADKVVIIIVAVLTLGTIASALSADFAFLALFFVVPLLIIAGIISTIFIAVGNSRAGDPVLSAVPVEAGTAPVGATLDELFPEPGTPPVPLSEPVTPPAPEASPYGPKS